MIKGSQLVGRAVIDMEAAERLGKIKEIIVQRDGERVAGFVVVHGETLVGTAGKRRMIPASAVHSIGPDAMTVRGSAMQEVAELDNLPRMSDIIGHKMVTRSGRLLGVIDDVLINRADLLSARASAASWRTSSIRNVPGFTATCAPKPISTWART